MHRKPFLYLAILCSIFVFAVCPTSGDLSFSDITIPAGVEGTGGHEAGEHGIAAADITNDGYPDLYVPLISGAADHYHPDLFFRNLQNNTFSEEAGSRGIDDYDGGSHGGCWADLDNDGDYDLINATTIESHNSGGWVPGCNNLFRNNGSGYFTEVTPGSISNRKEETRGLISFDMDNDGDLDLYFVNGWKGSGDSPDERNEVYRNDGDFSFTAFTSGALYTCPAGQGCVDTDWDGDGDIDVIACNKEGNLNILRNNGGFNNFTLVSPSSIGINHSSYAGVTTGDIDSDGDLDMILCDDVENGGAGGYLYRNNGHGTFSHIQTFQNADGYMAGFADLDNDGDLDLYISGDDVVYLNNGSGTFSTGPSVPVSGINDPRSHAFADIDNDGDMDFMIGVKRSRNYLIQNNYNSTDNKYLKVRLIAPNGQAGAFGAKVRIYPTDQADSTLLGMREAHSCHGYMGQDDPVLHFGLGSHSAVDVHVRFLNGTNVTRSGVPANSTILIDGSGHEPSGMRESEIRSLDRTGTQWHPYIEWSIKNPSYTGNPFDLVAAASFKHSGNSEIRKTEMFYAGENTWKFRFTGTCTGEWEFTTSSEDSDLDGKKGTVTINPNPDPDMHGFVTQFGNKWGWQGTNRAFVPQLVMYDNPASIYQNPGKIDKDIRIFLKEHGFNGFHTSVCCRWFDIHKERSHQIETPDPDFRTFEALELLITKTHIAGGLVHIWQWGDEQRRMTPHKWGLNGHEDKRLMRYIAARLGPIPGWTMGYGFDCDEWVVENDLKLWHTYMHDHFGWSHFLGARDPNPNYSSDPLTQIYEDLDYSGYEHFRPTYDDYVRTIEGRPSKPSFSEDRFRIRMPPKYPKKDYDEEMTRRGLYNSTMAGGVANIWGNAYPGGWTAGGGSKPYPHPEWIMTYSCFFNNRFVKDMLIENRITDGVCLKRPDNRHFVFYKEDAVSIQMDLSEIKGAQPAVAVDTKNIYTERSLGLLDAKAHTWTAPYKSDWVIAVGDFSKLD